MELHRPKCAEGTANAVCRVRAIRPGDHALNDRFSERVMRIGDHLDYRER